VTDLAVVTQDPRFGGGAVALLNAFLRGAEQLGRTPRVLHQPYLPLADSASQLLRAGRIADAARDARSVWVVAAAAPYGYPAARSGRPYAAWIATSLEDEWRARRPGLPLARRLVLAANAPLLRRLERATLRGAHRLYATSPTSRETLAEAAGLPAERIGILRIPVDVDTFQPEADKSWLARLDRPTVVFVGRGDDPRKNVRLLLEAWPAVHAALPDARLRLIGRPPRTPLPAGVEVAGEVPSITDAVRTASLLVLPSLQEGFGIVVAEALACGVPVVVTPSGGPEELVTESGGGVVLPDFAPASLAEAVVALLGDEARLLERRRSGRAYVEARHAPTPFREQLAAIFSELGDA
jgi:glycosyltransferase involved in cell wall biosynthesis